MLKGFLRPFLIVVGLAFSAIPSHALPLEVLLHVDATTAPSTPITVTITPAQTKLGASALSRVTTVGERCAFDVPAGSTWTLSVSAEGLYAAPRVVALSSAAQQVAIDLLPAGTVQGEVRMPKGEPLPKELTVRFRSVLPAHGAARGWSQGTTSSR